MLPWESRPRSLLLSMLVLLWTTPAYADLGAAEEECVNALNKAFFELTKAQGKDIFSCIKDFAKGRELAPAVDLEACLEADRKGKVAAAQGETLDLDSRLCSTVSPAFGFDGPGVIRSEGVQTELDLIHQLFGTDLSRTIRMEINGRDFSKCQQAVTRSLKRCQDTQVREFLRCKRGGLTGKEGPPGADLPFEDPADLELCIGYDPRGKIANACDPSAGKLGARVIPKKCVAKGIRLSVAFPGCATDDPGELAACLDRIVKCRVCLALNGVDSLDRDCDDFDNGAVDASCPLPPPLSPPSQVCGNAIVEGGEECDDGGNLPGDGCSASCQLENTSALCAGVPSVGGTLLRSELVASGFGPLTHVTAPPLDPSRLFLIEQSGRIFMLRDGRSRLFLDIRTLTKGTDEWGLFSLAFHPDYETNGAFFLNYTDLDNDTVVSRWEVLDPNSADPNSERILLNIDQPFGNHNGGQLAFDPNGLLYIGMGDGGSSGDPLNNGQNTGTLLGSMLRIDIDVESTPFFRIPAGNPFLGLGDPLDEIWATGLRNPWRFSFDRLSGDLYIADVGQRRIEEIDYQPAISEGGENYGWRLKEGTSCFAPSSDCDPGGITTDPVFEYPHPQGSAVVGGFVYRGCAMPDLQGTYFYSDNDPSFIRTFEVIGGVALNPQDRTSEVNPGANNFVTSFGEDARGELHFVNGFGQVFQILPGP